jgi:hypothetical protein
MLECGHSDCALMARTTKALFQHYKDHHGLKHAGCPKIPRFVSRPGDARVLRVHHHHLTNRKCMDLPMMKMMRIMKTRWGADQLMPAAVTLCRTRVRKTRSTTQTTGKQCTSISIASHDLSGPGPLPHLRLSGLPFHVQDLQLAIRTIVRVNSESAHTNART